MLIFVLQVSLTSWKPCVQLIFTFEVLSIGTFLAQLHKEEEPLVIATVEVSVEKFWQCSDLAVFAAELSLKACPTGDLSLIFVT